MKHLHSILLIMGLSLFSFNLQSQVYIQCNCQCGWGYFNTGQNHSVIFNTPSITLDGVALIPSTSQQVFIGAFYDSLGVDCNAGFMQWTGTPNALAAWQNESGMINGFVPGELMKWKICVVNTTDNTSQTYHATASYASGLPNAGIFATNGMSSVESMDAHSQTSPTFPGWDYTITGGNHSILIPSTATIAVDGQVASPGDYIGVFFDSLGTLICAGYTQWTGGTTAITAWGSDVGLDGFANNEEFKWMIWQQATGNSMIAAATYSTQFPNAGNYLTQGISGISSLIASSLQLDSITAPVSGCNLSMEEVSVIVTNPNPVSIQSFYISYSIDGATTISELINLTVPPGNSIPLILPLSVDVSGNGTHSITMYTSVSNPITTSLYNEINTVNLQFPQNHFCVDDAATSFNISPATAWVTGNGIIGNTFNPATAGVGTHWIHIGNAGLYNCPVEDSLQIQVHALPEISILNPGPLCIDEATISLSAVPAGGVFSGPGVSNNTFNPSVGTAPIVYEFSDTWGCTSIKNDTIDVQTPELIVLTGLEEYNCVSDSAYSFSCNGIPSGSGIYYDGNSWFFSAAIAGAGSHEIAILLSTGPCSTYDTVLVHVGGVPIVNIGGDTLIGANQSYELNAGMGYSTYSWSNGETTSSILASISGQYQVTVSNIFGCEGVSNPMTLYVAPWGSHISGVNHTILISANTAIQVGSSSLNPGDFIGVFYDDNGVKSCAGWVQWQGITTGLTAWGDDSTTPEKDGFEEGEAFEWRLFLAGTQEELVALATYTPFFPDSGYYITNGISSVESLTTSFTQTINLPNGWSMFSTFIDLFEPAVEEVFQPSISSVNIIKSGEGLIYWPLYGVNMLGNLSVGKGYQIHTFNAISVDFVGMKINPANTMLSLPLGWSILGYLRTSNGPIETMLAPIVNQIVIVKNDIGLIYWPAYNLNMINLMIPGEGYQLKLNAASSFQYPAN